MKQTETLLSVRARPFQGTSQTGKNGDLVGASPESFDNRAGSSGPREGHALHALEPSISVPCSLNWQGLTSVWGHPRRGRLRHQWDPVRTAPLVLDWRGLDRGSDSCSSTRDGR